MLQGACYYLGLMSDTRVPKGLKQSKYPYRTPFTKLHRELRKHKENLVIDPKYRRLLSSSRSANGTERTMTEIVREINKNRPLRLVHLAKPRGKLVDPGDNALKTEVERVISLTDKKSGKPISIGILKIFTKALEKHDGAISKIKKGKKPFGAIVREISNRKRLPLTVLAMPIAVKAQQVKAALKRLFSNPNRGTAKRVVDDFGLNSKETILYGRYSWHRLGEDNICKVIEFLRPGIE